MSDGSPAGRLRRWVIAAVVSGLVLVAVLSLAFTYAGRWLVTADPLRPSRAVVVLGGHVPFRAMEAADIYRGGWAREVWLTRGARNEEEIALERLGIELRAEESYSARVLERSGVPPGAIRVLQARNVNTADEVRAVARELRAAGGSRVIVVTSKSHARRLRVLWHKLTGGAPEIIVRYAARDPFDPARWWHSTRDAMAVAHEWGGLLNAWTGFPMASDRQ